LKTSSLTGSGLQAGRAFAATALLVAATLLWWLFRAFESDVADGFDGYYYVMQLAHLNRTGTFHSPDFNLFYLPLLAANWFLPPLQAYKTAVAFSGLLYSAGWFRVFRTRLDLPESLVMSLLVLVLPLSTFFALQFPKNLLGLAVLLFLVAARLSGKTVETLVCLPLLFFSHRLAFVLGSAFLLCEFLLTKIDKKKTALYGVMAAAAALCVLAFLVFAHHLFPGIVSIHDLVRIAESGTDLFSYWGPVSFLSYWELWRQPAWLADFALMHAGLAIAVYSLLAISHRPQKVFALLPLALLLPIWSFSAGSLGYRLSLNGWALASGLLFMSVPSMIPGKLRTLFYADNPLSSKRLHPLAYACVLLLLTGLASLSGYDHQRFNPPVALYKEIALRADRALQGTHTDLIIAHQGIKEQIITLTERDALNWKPDTQSPHTWRIMANVPDYALLRYLSREEASSLQALAAGYYLIQEAVFDRFIERLRADKQDSLLRSIDTWQNPLRQKPSFL